MEKKYKGKFLTFTFKGCDYKVAGIVLDYNDEWTLIRTFNDFVPDGFTIFKNAKVVYNDGERERIATKILKLKRIRRKDPKINLGSLDEMLHSINKSYRLIQLDTADGKACDVVQYLGKEGSRWLFRELTTSAQWRYELKLSEKECRFISFDSDYLNSLKLIAKFK